MALKGIDEFVSSYIEAMLWAERPIDENGNEGEAFEDTHEIEDIAPDSMEEIRSDCEGFLRENARFIRGEFERAGMDFYLTRNRHGAGFWDGGWSAGIGRRLTDSAHVYGTQGLDLWSDGKLHIHG